MLEELFSAIPDEFTGYLAPALDALEEFVEPFTGELPFFDAFGTPNATNSSGRKLLGMDDLLLVEVRNVPARSAPVASP